MLENIISIKPTSKYFKITWDMESACNYDCSYCFPARHNYIKSNNYLLKTAKELKKYWEIVYDSIDPSRLIDMRISGGEPTLNKNLLDFIKHISGYKNVNKVGIISNGSASTSLYLQLIPYITTLSISLHSEFFNEKKIFDRLYKCSQHPLVQSRDCLLHVLIMNEPNTRIGLYEDFCVKHNIYYTVQNIISNQPVKLQQPMHNTEYNFQ
jgi:organic radical activating enzyme